MVDHCWTSICWICHHAAMYTTDKCLLQAWVPVNKSCNATISASDLNPIAARGGLACGGGGHMSIEGIALESQARPFHLTFSWHLRWPQVANSMATGRHGDWLRWSAFVSCSLTTASSASSDPPLVHWFSLNRATFQYPSCSRFLLPSTLSWWCPNSWRTQWRNQWRMEESVTTCSASSMALHLPPLSLSYHPWFEMSVMRSTLQLEEGYWYVPLDSEEFDNTGR